MIADGSQTRKNKLKGDFGCLYELLDFSEDSVRSHTIHQLQVVWDSRQGQLRGLIMLIITDFAALRGGSSALIAKYDRCYSEVGTILN